MTLIYWRIADTLAVASVVFEAWSGLLAYTLTRWMDGAPYAWYLIMGGFALVLIRNLITLYSDIQSADVSMNNTMTGISLVVSIFFALGLLMLLRSAKRQLTVASQAPPPG